MVPHMGHTELGIAVVGMTYGYVVVPGRADWEWVVMKKDSDERVMCVTIQSFSPASAPHPSPGVSAAFCVVLDGPVCVCVSVCV